MTTAGGHDRGVEISSAQAKRVEAWYTLAVLSAVYLVAYLDRSLLSLLVQPIQADLHLSDGQIGLLQGFAFVILYGVLGYPIGRLADRHSRRLIVAFCLALWSLMTCASGLASGFTMLFLARVGVGIGEAGLNPCAYSLLADLFPRKRLARALAIYGVGAMLGSAVAFACGGAVVQWLEARGNAELWLIGTVRPWQMAFFLVSFPGILLLFIMPTVHEPRVGRVAVDAAGIGEFARFLGSARASLGLLTGATGLLLVVFYGFLSWIPTMLVRTHGLSVGQAGLAMGVVLGSFGLAGYLSGGWLCDRWAAQGRSDAHMRVGSISTLGLAPFGLLATLPSNTALSLIGISGLFFLVNFPSASAVAGLQFIAPARYRGQTTALFVLLVNLMGGGGGALLVGALTDHVFASKADLNLSLAVVAIVVGPLTAITYRGAMGPFARQSERLRRET